jgi:hypothetical protein
MIVVEMKNLNHADLSVADHSSPIKSSSQTANDAIQPMTELKEEPVLKESNSA